ncbi:MAG: DUF1501 domain-containing protein [Planctomycetaceae bacterium]|nr:DUF1501 domain-containing protein [Planctomycetaceae bacterium]
MMNRRHFMTHMAQAAAMSAPAAHMLAQGLSAGAADIKKGNKAVILLYMGAGPATIDIWDLKPGQPTGGEFKPISTTGDMQISEHMPLMAKQMHNAAIIRSMSTSEADHNRGRSYMHTGFKPDPNIEYPGYGAVMAHEFAEQSKYRGLEIPPVVSIGGPSAGPGFLSMAYSPFVVDFSGRVRNLDMTLSADRLAQRMQMLGKLESSFASQGRGEMAADHYKVLQNTANLLTSKQMDAFKIDSEPESVKKLYGIGEQPAGQPGMGMRVNSQFNQACLMARRLVQTGVPYVEIELGGWDDHQNVFTNLKNRLPVLDRGMASLIQDLDQQGMLKDTTVVWMGDFGRTPRINANTGRDHWARSWSTVVAGGGLKGGIAVGKTNVDGTAVDTTPYSSEHLMASVLKGLGVSLNTTYTTKNNRPKKIANGAAPIAELFA